MSLADLKRRKQEIKDREEARNRPKAAWLTEILGANPKKPEARDVVEVVFRQELDEAAPGYNEERGKGQVVVEHHGPGKDGYLKRASCTLEEEGRCYADERHAQNWEEGWKQRTNFYINVAGRTEGGEWKPYVLSRNFNSSFVDQLIMEAEDEGTITDKIFRITKSGSKTTTAWTPKRLKEDAPELPEDMEFFDIDEVVLRKIPYDKQPEWYGAAPTSVNDEANESGATSADDDW